MTKRRGRGEGSIFKRKDGRWCASVDDGHDENGKRQRRYVYGVQKKNVKEKLIELARSELRDAGAKSNKLNIQDYLEMWLTSSVKQKVRESTYYRYRILIRVHITPHIGQIKLNALTPINVQYLLSALDKKGASPRTMEFSYVILKSALKQAVLWTYRLNNPCDAVKKPRVPKRPLTCWSMEQVLEFLQIAKRSDYYALYLLALTTGMRQGELFGLRWEDVNFKNGTISIRQIIYEISGKFITGEPKTASGRRKITLPPKVLEALQQHRNTKSSFEKSKTWVFLNCRGELIRRGDFRTSSFLKLIEASQVPVIRFHDLRHTAATILLGEGVHPKIVQERLGHSQISITLDTYSHVLPTMQKEAADKLQTLFKDI